MGAYFNFHSHGYSFAKVYNVEQYVMVDFTYTDLTNIYEGFYGKSNLNWKYRETS